MPDAPGFAHDDGLAAVPRVPSTSGPPSPGAAPDPTSGEPAARAPDSRERRWRTALLGVAVFLTIFLGVTVRLFVWPERGLPSRASAIVMLDSPDRPLSIAVRLAAEHRAPFL